MRTIKKIAVILCIILGVTACGKQSKTTTTPGTEFEKYTSGKPMKPALSAETGVYKDKIELTMAAQEGTEIYYTTDGSVPTKDSEKYKAALTIKSREGDKNVLCSSENISKMYIAGSGYDYVPKDREVAKCTVIRAAAISPSGETSDIVTKTYFVGNDVKTKYAGASVISMVVAPEALLNPQTGIHVLGDQYDKWKDSDAGSGIAYGNQYWEFQGNYTQHGKEWERFAEISYFDADTEKLQFEAPIGIRLHGGASRMYGQKSFNIYFRTEYGLDKLRYSLLPEDTDVSGKAIEKYDSVMLRNGGNDTEYSKIRDLFVQKQLKDRAYQIQATKPCVLFLNGEYWGLYNLTEKYSDDSLENTFGIDKTNIISFKEGELEEGEEADKKYFDELMSYAKKDFTDDKVYEEFCKIMDIDSFADYYATQIYIANYDWNPKKNYQIWRAREADAANEYADGKWRYLLFDTEYSMGLYGHTDATTDSFTTTLTNDELFAAVMENTTFQKKFLETIKEIGSVNFAPETCNEALEKYTAQYQPLMQDYYTRFHGEGTWQRGSFDSNVKEMRDFIENRYDFIVPLVEGSME